MTFDLNGMVFIVFKLNIFICKVLLTKNNSKVLTYMVNNNIIKLLDFTKFDTGKGCEYE